MPYDDLPAKAFWKLCLQDATHHLDALYGPKFALTPGTRVAAAGSCFAQHFRRHVLRSDLEFLDMEPPPRKMSREVALRFGYKMFSARFGNIYTARQLRQLFEDAHSDNIRSSAIWTDGDRVFDGLRPNVEPAGFSTPELLRLHRLDHLARVRDMLHEADVFVFTLGLTEAWLDRASGTVFPVAPGTIAGRFDPEIHEFVNFSVAEVIDDLRGAMTVAHRFNPNMRVLLTVSPVPLTATASGQHVIQATTHSKSVLRAAAGEIANAADFVDYFPSYEIITSPLFRAQFFAPNLRTVTELGVSTVMGTFFGAHPALGYDAALPEFQITDAGADSEDDLICDELMLEEFARR